jgi:hypothetical protein
MCLATPIATRRSGRTSAKGLKGKLAHRRKANLELREAACRERPVSGTRSSSAHDPSRTLVLFEDRVLEVVLKDVSATHIITLLVGC